MITLRWARFPESDVKSYRVWRSMIGFKAQITDLTGKTLTLKINGGAAQTFSFTSPLVVETINATIQNGKAFFASNGSFIVRSNVRVSPGSVEIVGGTALIDLGLAPLLITETSDAKEVGTVIASATPNATETFVDNDGVIQDFYAISSLSSQEVESLKTPWRQPTQAAGPICVLEGVIADLQGVRIPDAEIRATLQVPPKNMNMTYITREAICTISGPDGRFSLPLLQGALIKLDIPSIGYTQMVTVPCQAYIFIQDLLVDENYTYPLGYR